MSTRAAVSIRLQAAGGGSETTQKLRGELVELAPGTRYIRYEETDPALRGTTTTVKVKQGELRLIRHGSVTSELAFVAGQRRSGSYQVGKLRMRMETITERLDSEWEGVSGRLRWTYRLIVDDEEHPEAYEMNLWIEEDMRG